MRTAHYPLTPTTRIKALLTDRVQTGAFQRLRFTHRRHDGCHAIRQHGFTRARRPDHQEMMPSCGGNLQSPTGMRLAANFMIGIAQALINDPPILILDEPTIGLDPTQIVEIRSLIKELGRERTIILSSHILPEVSQICQRILIINKGQIVAIDTPSNLTAQLQSNLQVYLEVEGPGSEIIENLGGMQGVLEIKPTNDPGAYLVETIRGQDLRPELARIVVERGWQLRELRLQDLSLEDIFMQVVTDETVMEEQA